MIGSGIRSGHAGLRLGTGDIIRIGGIVGIAARMMHTGIAATIGITAIPTARSATRPVLAMHIVTCVIL